MHLRLLSDGRSYIKGQSFNTSLLYDTVFTIPLLIDQVDIGSIQLDDIDSTIHTSIHPISIVYKGNESYIGDITSIDSNIVSMHIDDDTVTIRDYDSISKMRILRCMMDNVPDTLSLSYVSSGIESSIIHSIHIDKDSLQSDIIIGNNTIQDLNDVTIDIVTSTSPSYARALSSIEETSSGTIYTIDDTYNLPSGYTSSIRILDIDIDISTIYIIDAPNGRDNALYTIRWMSPYDIPNGSLYVYENDILNSISYISSTASGQYTDTYLSKISSVYSIGTIEKNDNTVHLYGTIYNTLSTPIDSILRYDIGDKMISDSSIERDGSYIVIPISIPGKSSTPYDITIDLI